MRTRVLCFRLLLITTFITFNYLYTKAQAFNDVNSTNVVLYKYEDVEGSPFLYDEWIKGIVKMSDGTKYNNIALKYNQESDKLYFKVKDGDILTFTEPVSEFALQTRNEDKVATILFRNGYKGISDTNEDSFFEVLVEGSTQLLKKTFKSIEENKEFNSATIKRKIVSVTRYYLVSSTKTSLVKLDKKVFLNALSDKQKQVEEYIKANNINFKKDSDLIMLITYYNSI